MRQAGAVLAWLALLVLAGCAQLPPPDAFISGVAVVQRPVAFVPDAVFEAELVRWDDGGAPPTVLARQRLDDAGMPPYALHLAYRQAQIAPQGHYRVRARLSAGERLLLATQPDVPALLDPALRRVDVLLQPMPALAATAQAQVPLLQTWWRLAAIADLPQQAIGEPAAQAQPAHLLLQAGDERLTGSGGCNRFSGHYQLQGAGLRFSGFDAALRLCLHAGVSEAAFFERLPRVASYWQRGRTLELRDAGGKALLRLQAEERGLAPLPPAPAALRR